MKSAVLRSRKSVLSCQKVKNHSQIRNHNPVVVPGPSKQYLTKAHPFPDAEEERDVSHDAFMNAVEQSNPNPRIPGLQEFAAAIWERKRRIPSGTYNNPLHHLFNEFDLDNDNVLTAEEIAHALQGRRVKITSVQVQEFINAVDTNHDGVVNPDEFEKLIFHMATVDLRNAASGSAKADAS